MTQPGATEFSWKRELPFMLLPVVVVLLAHLPAAPYAEAVWNADGAITALIAKHHWQGQLPIYFYGQNYNGSIEPLFSAPFYKLYGASVEGIAVSKSILSALVSLVIFRLCFDLGGRGAALAGSLPFALGTWVLMVNLARQNSYLVLLALGALILLISRPLIDKPTPRRTLLLGLVGGIAWFNNPQIVSFLIPPFVLFYLRGETCRLIREKQFGTRVPRPALVLLAVLGLWSLASVAVALIGDIQTTVFGIKLSLTRAGKYVVRSVGSLGAALILLEFYLSPHRKAWLKLGGLSALGFLLGNTPTIYHRLAVEHGHVRKLRGGLDPGMLTHHLADFRMHAALVLFNRSDNSPTSPGMIATTTEILFWITLAIVLTGAAGWIVCQHRALWDMLRLRPPPTTLGLLLGLQAIVLSLFYLCHPHEFTFDRYLLTWWVAYCGLFSGIFAVCYKRIGQAAWIVSGLWLAFFGLCAVQNIERIKQEHATKPEIKELRQLNQVILEAGYDRGYCSYWQGFQMIYLTDEKLIMRTWPEIEDLVHPPYVDAVNRSKKVVWVFKPERTQDRQMQQIFEKRYKPQLRIIEQRQVGRYLLYFAERR